VCRALHRFRIAVLLAGLGVFGITSSFADAWNITVGGPNGRNVPRVMGGCSDIDASGYTALDYFEWFGITHYRYWFRLGSSPLNPTGGVTTATGFNNATALIRADPLRQGTASDVYYDWNFFNSQFGSPYVISTMVQRGIQPMMVNTTFTGEKPLSSWGAKFRYWKTWYAYVYYFASNHGVQMYEFKNEPDLDADVTYADWESHWIVAADAMRKAMADVNANYGKNLILRICGPTTAGNGWTSYGQPSWSKVKTNIHGEVDPSIWNYGMYAYHHYTNSGSSLQSGILAMRNNLTNANPSSSMPIVLTEFNTSTGRNLRTLGLDTEDIDYGIGLSKILPGTVTNGPTGLGDEGGTFLFKLADTGSGATGIENKVVYMSPNGRKSMGGITRGGATYQLFARHFRGGKPLLGTTVTAGSHADRRLVAALDEKNQAYCIYLSNFSGTNATVTLNLSALDVLPSSPVTIARVNQNQTGHIGQIVTVSSTKQITFDASNKNALLIWIPKGKAARTMTQSFPVQDTYLTIGQPAVTPGSETSVKISMHHSDPNERRIGFLRFDLNDLTNGNRFLLKIPGINSGANTTARRILHVYGAGGGTWDESNLAWATAPGVGKYRNTPTTLLNTTGLGPMVDIEANYRGATVGEGLGLHGKFLGPVSYFTGVGWAQNYLDVTDYVKSLMAANQTSATFVIAQTVRYNVNTFSNDYYNKGVYDYNGQITEIGTREHPNSGLRSALVTHFDDPTASTFFIEGVVRNVQGNPLQGVVVRASPTQSATADASGRFIITGLAAGTYTLSAPACIPDGFTNPVTVGPSLHGMNFLRGSYPLTWDADSGVAGAQDGGGTWVDNGGNWRNATTGANNQNWNNTNLDSAIFGAGADGTPGQYVVNLGTQIAATSLTFNNSGYRIGALGSTLALMNGTANGSITVAAGKVAIINPTLRYNQNTAALITVNSGGELRLNGGTTAGFNPQLTLTGDGTISIFGGTFQTTVGSRNAALINQTAGTWTMTDNNNVTSIGFNAGRDVNYRVSGTATLNVLAFADANDFYTLSLGRNMGNFTSTLTLQSGGAVNVGVTANRAGQINLGSFDGNGNSLLDIQGGTLTVGTGKTTNKLYFFAGGANAAKTATMKQSGGTVTANGIQFGANTGDNAGGLVGANSYNGSALATLRLSGGNLHVGAQGITRGTAATDLPVTIHLLGGTLGASQNWSSSMDMRLNNAIIRAADSGGTARNISLSGDLSNEDGGDGALTKTGPGILTLTGTNTYTGATTVSAGELKHSTAGSATTDITVAPNASHGVLVASEDGQWVNTGTLTHENGSDMTIDFGSASPSTTAAPIKVDSLTLGTGIRTRISGLVSGFLPGKTLPLVTWTDSGPADASAFSSIILPAGISGTLGVTDKTLSLTVTGNTGLLMWNTGDGDWDTVTANWVDSSLVATTYTDLTRTVMFGDAVGVTGDPMVTLNNPVSPPGVLMKSTGHDYTITGSGSIAGSGGLVLGAANTRTLTLANGGNTFTGSTIIGGGTLRISGNARLGSGTYAGAISIADGATFEYAGSALQTLSGAITGTGGTVKHSTSAGLSLTNAGNGFGSLSIGNGRVFISTNAGALPSAATVNITGGLLVFSTGTSYANSIAVSNGGGIATRNPTGTGLTGAVTLAGSGTVIFNNDDVATHGLSITSDQTLTGNLTVQVGGNRTNLNPVGAVTLSGKLTGEGVLTVASSGLAGSVHFGTGVLTLTGANDYSGGTTLSQGTLSLGTAGTLGDTTGPLTVGNANTVAAGTNVVLNLATAANTTVGSLGGSIASPASGTNTATIQTQNGRTFTVNQTEAGIYQGVIAGGGNFTLGNLSTHTLTLAGANTYSGDTTVNAGTLSLASAPDPANANPGNDASTVTIAKTGATLDLAYTGTDVVDKLIIGTTQMPAGAYGKLGSALPVIGVAQITGDGTLSVTSGPTSGFDAWIAGGFANGTVPIDQRGPDDDPDNDGIPNLLEYAIDGQDPTVSNPSIGTLIANTLSFTKREGTIGITYAIQQSIDLGAAFDWAEVENYLMNDDTTISYTLTPTTPQRNFLRLRVVQD